MLMKIICVTNTNDKSKCTLVFNYPRTRSDTPFETHKKALVQTVFSDEIPTRNLNGHLEFFASFIIKLHLM